MKLALPIYYRNKIYTEEEREKLWINKLNEKKRYIMGQRLSVKTKKDIELFYEILKNAQNTNKKLGYKGLKEWDLENYNKKNKEINK